MAFEHGAGESPTSRPSASRAETLLTHLALALSEFVTLERSPDGDGMEGHEDGVFLSLEVQEREGVHEAHLFTIPVAELPASATLSAGWR